MNASLLPALLEFLHATTGQTELDAQTDLLESVILDSLTLMDVLVFIETEFQVRLDFADVNPTVFRTAADIAGLVAERTNHGESSAAA